MASVQVKYFDGNPGYIQNLVNKFLRENADKIDIVDFKVVSYEYKAGSETRNVFWLMYREK
jgi:hypothetical protein